MADLETLAKQVAELRDLEDIKSLKHRYFRAMTFSDHDLLEGTLTEDVKTSYSDGAYVYDDRQELLDFLIKSHQPEKVIAYWMAAMPEITLNGETSASGIWAMYHHFYDVGNNFGDEMFVYYNDEYRKEDGVWKICKTGYTRVLNQQSDKRKLPYRLTAPTWAVEAQKATRDSG